MLELRDIRADPERLREVIRARRVDPAKADVDRWLALDARRRRLQGELDAINVQKKQLAGLGRSDPDAARGQGQELRAKSRAIEGELAELTSEWQSLLDWFPNWPHPDMPRGTSEADNVEECAWIPGQGYVGRSQLGKGAHTAPLMPQHPPHADEPGFRPLPHADLGPKLGIDTLQAAKVSGSRFAYLIGDVARMQLAIHHLLTAKLLAEGFEPIVPPLLVRERSLYGTSHFPEGRDQVYEIKTDYVEEATPLFLVGSSEPANFSYFMDRTLREEELPVKLFAATPCFRSEAGSWGKDVKGIKRVHQFDKIELNAVCAPEQSESIYEAFRAINEWLLQTLELPYHIVDKCTGDAGYLASHRQRDAEVWLPGSREFMEVMTDTNTTDYQARRLNVRYRTSDGATRICHTVNDTGCAMGRMLLAIVENYQQHDGAVKVPAALRPLVGKDYLARAS
ncbi:MAG TPA: serine--tRNA ligase [Chloroflexota bacterium]|nr:serine--tRNA ligase [Chloroflexota bacterium]